MEHIGEVIARLLEGIPPPRRAPAPAATPHGIKDAPPPTETKRAA